MTEQPTLLEAVATGIADVAPAWAAAATDAPPTDGVDLTSQLGRDRAFGVELIREGWLTHRGVARIATGASPNLALLIGDWCYAAGLCAIADHGSLDDVAALAELVADLSARAEESTQALDPYWSTALEAMHHG